MSAHMKSHRQPKPDAVALSDEGRRKTRSGLTCKIKSHNDSAAEIKTMQPRPMGGVETAQMQNETMDLYSPQTAKEFLPTVSQNKNTGEI